MSDIVPQVEVGDRDIVVERYGNLLAVPGRPFGFLLELVARRGDVLGIQHALQGRCGDGHCRAVGVLDHRALLICFVEEFRYACGRCGIGRSCEDSLGELRFAGESGLVGCVNVLPRLADALRLVADGVVDDVVDGRRGGSEGDLALQFVVDVLVYIDILDVIGLAPLVCICLNGGFHAHGDLAGECGESDAEIVVDLLAGDLDRRTVRVEVAQRDNILDGDVLRQVDVVHQSDFAEDVIGDFRSGGLPGDAVLDERIAPCQRFGSLLEGEGRAGLVGDDVGLRRLDRCRRGFPVDVDHDFVCAYDVLAYVAGNACCTEVHRSEFRVVNEFRVVDAQDEFADLGFVRNLGRLAGVGVVFGRYGVSADADFRAKQFVDVVQRHQGLASVERSQQLRIFQQRLLADGLLVERHFDGGVVVGDRLLVLGVNAEFDLLGLVGHDAGEVRQHVVRYLRGGFVLGAGSGIHGVLDRKGQRDPFTLFLIKLTKLFRRHGGGYGELTLLDKPNVGDGGCGSCRCGTGFYLLGDNSERRFSVSIGIYEVFGQRGRRDAVG